MKSPAEVAQPFDQVLDALTAASDKLRLAAAAAGMDWSDGMDFIAEDLRSVTGQVQGMRRQVIRQAQRHAADREPDSCPACDGTVIPAQHSASCPTRTFVLLRGGLGGVA